MESLLTGEALFIVEHRACARRGNREEREEAQLSREKRSKNNRGRLWMEQATVMGAWLMVVSDLLNGTTLSAEEFQDNIRIRFGLLPLDLRQTCDWHGDKLMVDHALHCKRSGLVTVRHYYVAAEWGALCAAALTPSVVAHRPFINYGRRWTVTGWATKEADNEELDRQDDAEREERQGDDKDLMADEKE